MPNKFCLINKIAKKMISKSKSKQTFILDTIIKLNTGAFIQIN